MGTIKNAEYYIDNGVDFDEYRFKTDAKVVQVIDAGNNFAGTNMEMVLDEVGSKLKNFTTNINSINSDINNIKFHSVYRLSKDSNGIFTDVRYRRADGSVYLISVLSGGTSPNYTTRTETYYDTDSITVLLTKTYTISYDSDGDIENEVLQ